MASTYRMVAYGSSGSAVKELQEALNRHGYDLEVDGVFGDKTRAAVRSYQQRNGLQLDGVAGDETWGSLMGTAPQEEAAAPAVSQNTAAVLEKLEQGFTPSADTEAARDYAESMEAAAPGDYRSAFEAQLAALYDEITGREAFAYDPAEDAAFAQYARHYHRAGKAAMEDTLAQGAHLTGGYGSSYAQSAAQQAYNGFLEQLNQVMPSLQEAAYERYLDEGKALLERYELLHSRDESDYERYLRQVQQWQEEREAAQKHYESLSDSDRRHYQLLLDYFTEKAEAEGKGEVTTDTAPTAASAGTALSSTGAQSLLRAMTNYLRKGDAEAAKALYRRYDKRITPSQRSRFDTLFAEYQITL